MNRKGRFITGYRDRHDYNRGHYSDGINPNVGPIRPHMVDNDDDLSEFEDGMIKRHGVNKGSRYRRGKGPRNAFYRWLHKQVGRPWDKVHPEALERLGEEARENLDWAITLNTMRDEDGQLWDLSSYCGPTKLNSSYRRFTYYVDPEGVVRMLPKGERYKYRPKVHFHVAGSNTYFRHPNGDFFAIANEDITYRTRYGHGELYNTGYETPQIRYGTVLMRKELVTVWNSEEGSTWDKRGRYQTSFKRYYVFDLFQMKHARQISAEERKKHPQLELLDQITLVTK